MREFAWKGYSLLDDLFFNQMNSYFSIPKQRDFVDREKIWKELMEALYLLKEDPDYFSIFIIYGMGGMGKSRLVDRFVENSKDLSEILIHVSFEIEKQENTVNNLYKIRKELGNATCPLFDLALLHYWEMTQPARINDDFMKRFNKNFFTSFIDIASEIAGCAFSDLAIPTMPSASSVIDFINDILQKISQSQNKEFLQNIMKSPENELLSKLPWILGYDIRNLVNKKKLSCPIFVFDSYRESQPYSESEEWLFQLIQVIGKGLFLVTAREKLHWSSETFLIIPKPLECYPESAMKEFLSEIPEGRKDIIDEIIHSTQGIPIYVSLALDIYEQERDSVGAELVDKAFFSDRHKLVQHFIGHLKEEWQQTILNLAVIQIFDQKIFLLLVNNRILPCMTYEYENIVQCSLFHYSTKDADLVKLHDVFSRDARKMRPVVEQYEIYKVYLKSIQHISPLYKIEAVRTLTILFENLLILGSKLEEQLNKSENRYLETEVIEGLLDVFFSLVSVGVHLNSIELSTATSKKMVEVCKLISAQVHSKKNTLETIHRLQSIEEPEIFGKHKLSYEAILHYQLSISGRYDLLKSWLMNVEKQSLPSTQHEWFYNKIKIYRADYDMMEGKFHDAYEDLKLLQNNDMTAEDSYDILRTIGHIQRFNMHLEEAEHTYEELFNSLEVHPLYREYLLTNLCEVYCYFPSDGFLKWADKVIASMEHSFSNRNKAKALYSRAIAKTVMGHYSSAAQDIHLSVEINRSDGYPSGELFAQMARAYLDYAQEGTIQKDTLTKIETLLYRNKLYLFFRLPLAIMSNDEKEINRYRYTYKWLDFEHTISTYTNFLKQLKPL